MKAYDLGRLLDCTTRIASMAGMLEMAPLSGPPGSSPPGFCMPAMAYADVITVIQDLERLLVQLEMPVTLAAAKRLHGYLTDGAKKDIPGPGMMGFDIPHVRRIKSTCEHLTSRIHDEIDAKLIYMIPASAAGYFNSPIPLLGTDVANAFPSTVYDMTEAGNCLALERSTACVFHLMRIMEMAIGSIARCLGIPDPVKPNKKHWGAISQTIQTEINARNVAVPPGWAKPDDKVFFSEIYILMEAVRGAWRNPTMHPDRKHTQEEAFNIFGAVKTFMAKISSRLDEKGEPKA
jgi:hypothetical protein